jgi:FkbM family methyltransferase
VEIGAYHPVRLSNTYRFYKKGWRGVVVEPNPDIRNIFNKLRSRDVIVNKGVGTKNGLMKYFKYDIPALNTFSQSQVDENTTKGFQYREIANIEILGIKLFLKKYIHKKIDLLSLDVEGWDEQILKAWNWKHKPKIICVETEENGHNIGDILAKVGYKLYFENKVNSIYVL